MPKVPVDLPAPDFSLEDYLGQTVRISDYFGRKNVLLVFNRSLM